MKQQSVMAQRPIEYSNLDKVVTVRVSLMSLSDRDKCQLIEDLFRDLAGLATPEDGIYLANAVGIAHKHWWNK